MFVRSKAFTITEMLVAIAMSIILMLALFELYESTQKIFFNTNSISGAEENAYNAYVIMQKYFDRAGVGVPSNTLSTGGYPPPAPNYVSISSGSPCDSITFYGDLYGFGMVQSISNGNAYVISCRLSDTNPSGSTAYYYLVRGENFYYSNSSNTSPDVFTIDISPNNVSCISTTSPNASISGATIYDTNTAQNVSLSPGDVLYSVPYQISFFCKQNPSDNNNLWLYLQTVNEATNITNTQPIVPVQSVSFSAYPQGCLSTNSCNMIQATIGVNSSNKNASGSMASITFSFDFYK
ncbi:PilW family protein [Hydrogenobaculum acidophilum]